MTAGTFSDWRLTSNKRDFHQLSILAWARFYPQIFKLVFYFKFFILHTFGIIVNIKKARVKKFAHSPAFRTQSFARRFILCPREVDGLVSELICDGAPYPRL